MIIYNTLTRKKEEFKPIDPPNVSMYVCGPTIYNYFHIGNGRTFMMTDVIRRYLIYKGYNLKYVMNLTDVDDKIIRKANEENIDPKEITNKYEQAFLEDSKRLKIRSADIYPKATDHIDEIESIISSLESKDVAYNVEGNVFYNVEKFKGYGKLSGKKTDDLEVGARIEVNKEKKNPLDFSLWKKAKEGEPSWSSPWGEGRPGWHIECSAMSMKHLGETIDIHAGGNDLIFPHHENEIAQSEASTGKDFVKYWMHFGFLNLNKEKMSKSLGNFFTTRDILDKYPAEAIRLLFVQSHYGSPLNFSEELLNAAQKGAEKISKLGRTILKGINRNNTSGKLPEFQLNKYENSFNTAMDDDFNTPQATSSIFDFVHDMNKIMAANDDIDSTFFSKAKKFLSKTADEVLGIVDLLELEEENKDDDEWIMEQIELRKKAKEEKNYQLADQIRNELFDKGIVLEDTKTGTTYKIK